MLPVFNNPAACEGTNTNDWFPESGNIYHQKELLIRICAGCQAKAECLEYALEYNVDGWWAGTTDGVRKQIRRHRGISAKPVMPDWEIRARGA